MNGQYLEEKVFDLEYYECSNCDSHLSTPDGFIISRKSYGVDGCPNCLPLRGVCLSHFKCENCGTYVDDDHEMTVYFDNEDLPYGCEDCVTIIRKSNSHLIPSECIVGRWHYEYH